MKAVAVTAGNEGWFRYAACRFAFRWRALSTLIEDGFPCIDASDMIPWNRLHHTMFAKAFLWDVVPKDTDVILWVDADVFQSRPVGLSELPTAPFSAVRDMKTGLEAVRREWPRAHEVPSFFNAGVFVATREAMPVFEDMQHHTIEGLGEAPYGDQCWWNLYVQQRLGGWNQLDQNWNYLVGEATPPRPLFLHFAGVNRRDLMLDMFHQTAAEMERCILAYARREAARTTHHKEEAPGP